MTKSDIFNITQQYNAKKGIDIFVVRVIPSVGNDGFATLRGLAKQCGGYYSTFVHGFVFDNEEAAGFFGGDVYNYFEGQNAIPEFENATQSVVSSKKRVKKNESLINEAINSDKRRVSFSPYQPQVPNYDMSGIGTLKLHEAIKRIIDCDGIDALLDITIVNLLSDFQAYKDEPAAKFVLRIFISEGYAQKLMSIGKWNDQCQKLIKKIIAETGFQSYIVDMVFQSVAYALGWKKSVEIAKPTNGGGTTTSQPSPITPPIQAKPSLRASSEKWEDYLENLIEWKVDMKNQFNLDCTVSIRVDDDKDFHILTTLNGKHKGIDLNADIYNENNKLKVSEPLLYSCDAIKGYCSKDCWICDIKANKVGKIIIYEGS